LAQISSFKDERPCLRGAHRLDNRQCCPRVAH
jgi:hypothetical protein